MALTLYIVRHAKAEERAGFLPDFDRNLTPDGTIAAARMGRYLRGQHVRPDAIISSPAHRTRDTANVLAEQLGFPLDRILFDEHLYEGGPKAYLAAVNALPADVQTALIVGHNPDVSYFAEYLTHQPIGTMSKGEVVAVRFENLTWAAVSGRTGTLDWQIAPKQLPKAD